jgi:hypothetical protein
MDGEPTRQTLPGDALGYGTTTDTENHFPSILVRSSQMRMRRAHALLFKGS